MATKAETELILRAASVATGNAEQWKYFTDALYAYVEEQKEACLQSDVARLQFTQGFARGCMTMRDIISKAVTSADRLKK